MVRDYQQAEDLTHETFLKAYEKQASFKGASSEKTWLFRIAHNVTIDYIRKRKPIILFKEILLHLKEVKEIPEEYVLIKESSYELYQAISSLKTDYRVVIILRKLKEFSIQETAAILGWTESKVKSTLFRALAALEKQLKKEVLLNGEIFKSPR